ncbi:hypothetical protein Patl1_21713 [Pistacia atlantica]|uniref:Uncharacterized protein n=1 Tax=Pistacia atlantica TaxID=434234 RepID=A0ACC1BIW9_9ROSI|nr:hypothetical protein Patl1_21713 [Pistacia atlantica]
MLIPLMELSQRLVKHGIRVTFVNTYDNRKRIVNALAMKDDKGNQIHLVSVALRLESPDIMSQQEQLLEAGLRIMQRKAEELIEEINASDNDKVTCVLADPLLTWNSKEKDVSVVTNHACHEHSAHRIYHA